MEVVESELEVGHVSVSVGLAFKGLDLVVDSFYEAGTDPVIEVGKEPIAVSHEGLRDSLQLADATGGRILTPCLEEL